MSKCSINYVKSFPLWFPCLFRYSTRNVWYIFIFFSAFLSYVLLLLLLLLLVYWGSSSLLLLLFFCYFLLYFAWSMDGGVVAVNCIAFAYILDMTEYGKAIYEYWLCARIFWDDTAKVCVLCFFRLFFSFFSPFSLSCCCCCHFLLRASNIYSMRVCVCVL